jgi:hypothetical protein
MFFLYIEGSKVRLQALIRRLNEPSVEQTLVSTNFVACHQQDALAQRVKSERDTPNCRTMPKPQFFQVGVPSAFERIDGWPTESRAKRLQEFRVCQQLVLNGQFQRVEFGFEVIMKQNLPSHAKLWH